MLSSHDDHCVVNVNRILSLFIPSFDYIYHCDSAITINIVSTKQVRKDAQNISPETIGSEFRIMQGSSGFQGYKNLRGNMLHLKKNMGSEWIRQFMTWLQRYPPVVIYPWLSCQKKFPCLSHLSW